MSEVDVDDVEDLRERLRGAQARELQWHRATHDARAERDQARGVARRLWVEITHGTDCVTVLRERGDLAGVNERHYPWLEEMLLGGAEE